ncbi:helix-turn-helix transcriptional regulator [Candidatus Sumerlaeota bacterium]|nr:helix-turn-helix transcriptional regulator [Candidatus Sumerlaeota bacterium]
MDNLLGKRIQELRKRMAMTQDQFGTKYGVSGPAIFKFEKNYVKPSLELWMRMSEDCGMSERQAVLLWVKAKLPERYHEYIDLQGADELAVGETSSKYAVLEGVPEYTQVTDRELLRKMLKSDDSLPLGIRELVADDEFWVVFKPTGAEIYGVVQKFGMFHNGSKALFSEALRLMRNFLANEAM